MDLLQDFGTSPEKENEGIWIDVGADTRIRVARWNNAKYRRLFAERMQPFNTGRKPTDEQSEEILVYCIARAILLDWENVSLDGEELPYTHENAERVLRDERLRDFRDFVVRQATSMEGFRYENLEADVGKSQTT